jgi:hypothetical protein
MTGVFIFLAFLLTYLVSAVPVFAQWCSGGPASGVRTALGCLNTSNPTVFVEQIINWAVGLSGGFALLLVVYGAFMMVTSAGDPKRVNAGKEVLVSAFAGVAIIALCIVVLNFIGVRVLNIF